MKEVVTIQLNCTPPYCPNISDFIGDDPLYVYDNPQNILLISIYIPLFLAALISNILVIVVVSRYRCLRSVTNYFLVNLSVSDLLVTLICMPMAVGQAIHSLWVYGDLMCKLSNYLQGVAVTSGVFTITAMSLDRYMAIRHPMSRKIINRPRARKIIILIWFLSLAVFSPILFIRKTQGFRFAWDVDSREFLYCVESWPDNMSQRSFGIFCFVVVYAIPGCIVVVAYSLMGLRLCSRHLLPEYQLTHMPSTGGTNGNNNNGPDMNQNSSWQVSSAGGRLIRERRRVAKILLVLALVFAFCWLPYSVLSLFLDLSSKADEGKDGSAGEDDVDEKLVNIATSLIPFTLLLGHVNSADNPLLYCLLSKNVRRSVTDLIRHPTIALRSRQQFKIRMTFRRDPHPSADQQSADNKPPVCRPRNHHAPEPPPPLPTASNSNGSRGEPQEICLQDMTRNNGNHHHHHHFNANSQNGVHAVVSYSPSSNGYSSIRCSADNIGPIVHCHSSQFPYFNTSTGGVSSSTPSYGNGYIGNNCECSTASVACCHCGKGSGIGGSGCPLTLMSSASASIVSSPTGCCSYHSCHHVHGNPNVCPAHCCVAFQGKKGVTAMDCRKVPFERNQNHIKVKGPSQMRLVSHILHDNHSVLQCRVFNSYPNQ